MSAGIYTDANQAYAVTPSLLPAPDPTRAPDILTPVNALSLPASTPVINLTPPAPGFLPNGQPDPNYKGAPDPSAATAPQVRQAAAATTSPAPITTTANVPTKVATPSFESDAPYSRNWFINRIPYGEATPDGRMSSAGAYGHYQVLGDTYLHPGYGVQGGNPDNIFDMNARDAVGRDYAGAMYDKYGPALGAAAYNQGPGTVDAAIKMWGDPRKGPITTDEWIGKFEQMHPGFRGYLDRMAGGHLAIPGQTPASQTAVAANVDAGQTKNPLAMQAPQDQADIQAQMRKYWAMAAMASLIPRGFAFHPVAYDPRQVLSVAKGEFSGIHPRELAMSGMPGVFSTPRVVLGSGQGPTATAISPANIPTLGQGGRRRSGGE